MAIATASPAATGEVDARPGDDEPASRPRKLTVTLRVEHLEPEGDSDMPRSRVFVQIPELATARSAEPIATYNGGCSPAESPAERDPPEPPALLTLLCWWAGAGDYVELTMGSEGDALLVRHAWVDEPAGDKGGGVGLFEVVRSIPWPRGAKVEIAPPTGS